MDLKTKISDDMKAAMKAGDSVKVSTLRMLLADIKKKEIDQKKAFTDEDVFKSISYLIKQRKDSIEAFEKGGRKDLADKEAKEAELLTIYLPKQLEDSEIEKLVKEIILEINPSGMQQMGLVMKAVLPKIAGRADSKRVNEIVKNCLAK